MRRAFASRFFRTDNKGEIVVARPTENAEYHFNNARMSLARLVLDEPALSPAGTTAAALINIAEGLMHLSVGLRATYNEVQEVKRQLALRK